MLSRIMRVFLLVVLLVTGNTRYTNPLGIPPAVTDLRIERIGLTVNLTWTHNGSGTVKYEVWRGKSPYAVSPPDAVKLGDVTPGASASTVTYRDWGSANGFEQVNYSYFVRAVDVQGNASSPSNRAGDFDFALGDPGIWRPARARAGSGSFEPADIDTSFDVQMYDIDLVETPQAVIDELHAAGRVVICYFSPGSWEDYRPDADDFPESVLGNVMDGWPDERWLDIRQLDVLSPIMEARLDLAVQKRCDGVEPDNIEGYNQSLWLNVTGFPLTYPDQQTYNTWLAKAARSRGLSIGLKNDLGQIDDLLPFFDWALNEQCFQYDECDPLSAFVAANKAVFGVEYSGNPTTFCPKANAHNFDWLKKHLDLDAWRVACR